MEGKARDLGDDPHVKETCPGLSVEVLQVEGAVSERGR